MDTFYTVNADAKSERKYCHKHWISMTAVSSLFSVMSCTITLLRRLRFSRLPTIFTDGRHLTHQISEFRLTTFDDFFFFVELRSSSTESSKSEMRWFMLENHFMADRWSFFISFIYLAIGCRRSCEGPGSASTSPVSKSNMRTECKQSTARESTVPGQGNTNKQTSLLLSNEELRGTH